MVVRPKGAYSLAGVVYGWVENPFDVQKAFLPVYLISAPHFGQVCPFQWVMFGLPHLRHSLPASLRYDGATSPIIPPTTTFRMV